MILAIRKFRPLHAEPSRIEKTLLLFPIFCRGIIVNGGSFDFRHELFAWATYFF